MGPSAFLCLPARYAQRVVTKHHPSVEERDERVSIPLPPEEAIAAFLAVRPPTDPDEAPEGGTDADPDTAPAQGR